MSNIQFGWYTLPSGTKQNDYTPIALEQQDRILPTVARYFDSLWTSDHLYAFNDPTKPFLECWTTLTWLASRFPNIYVGPIVMAVGYRSPALLAKMASTLQTLSGGRFIMGIGGGWREEEYHAYGYPFPKPSERIAQLEEAIHIMRAMWTDPASTYTGTHFQVKNAYNFPQPTPPPIMIGGGGEQLLIPLAARIADIWDLYHGGNYDTIDLQSYSRKRDILYKSAEAAGRNPTSIVQSLTIDEAAFPTSPDQTAQWLDSLRACMGLGVTQFILDFGHVPSTDLIEQFAQDVMLPIRDS